MNCGVISIIMQQFPYNSHWLRIIGTIIFVLDFVFFIAFGSIMLLRLAMFRKQAMHEISSDPDELAFLANMPIAWLTITALISLIVSRASWGGHWATVVAYVMWWIGAAWMIATTWTVYVILTRRFHLDPSSITTTFLIPAVGVATVATEGALISSYSHGISARMAVPVIIFSFMCVGFGLFLAVMLYSLFLHRLLTSGLPEPKKYFTLPILVRLRPRS
jgi:tellurite resistance protein TehA-like permease